MEEYEKNIVPHIEAIYETFTSLEKYSGFFYPQGRKRRSVSKERGETALCI